MSAEIKLMLLGQGKSVSEKIRMGWLRLFPKAINKTAYVTYVPRVDKTGIKKIVTSDCK